MLTPLVLAQSTAAQPAQQHWLRLSLRTARRDVAGANDGEPRRWQSRLGPMGHDLRQFLMTYSAGLVATAAFIA